MSYLVYKLIHIAGILGLFTAMGSIIATDRKRPVMMTKFVIMHGISLVFILVSGFGMSAKGGLGFPGWMIAKLAIWAVMGAMLVVLKRGILSPTMAWPLIIGLGTLAGYLAIYRPF